MGQRQLTRNVLRSVVLLAALATVQLIAMAAASAQEATIGKPSISASGSLDGDITFRWGSDVGVDRWTVAVINGDCGLGDDSIVTTNQVTCAADVGATQAVCVSVKAYASDSAAFSPFANWRCADGDAFGIDPDGGDYLQNDFAVGRVSGTTAPDVTGFSDCIVDLSFRPYRYACMQNETALDAATAALVGVVEAQDRVFWIGSPGESVVEDFDPTPLKADIKLDDDRTAAVLSPGVPLVTTYTVTNEGPAIAPSVGVTLPIAEGYDLDSIIVPDGCTTVLRDMRCFAGDLAVGEQFVFVVEGTPAAGATAGKFKVVLVIDTDIPAPNEQSEGEKSGSSGGGGSGGGGGGGGSDGNLGTNGRETETSAVYNFGETPGDDEGAGGDGSDDGPDGPWRCVDCDPADPADSNGEQDVRETGGNGDPHLTSFDGVRFGFQASGDYLLAQSQTSDYEFHVRFGRSGPRQISWNWGYAARVGDSVLTFGDDPTLNLWDPTVVHLDGVQINPTTSVEPLPGGATIRFIDSSFERYEVLWPDGTRLWVGERVGDTWRLLAGENLRSSTIGLAGDADGQTANDLVAADGALYDYDSLERYTIFGDSWFLQPEESMFETELTDDALLPIIPLRRFTISELAAAALAEAEALCRAEGFLEGEGLAECIFDIAITGDTRLIEGSKLIQSLLRRSISALAALGVIEDDVTVTVPNVLVGEITTARKIDVYRFDLDAGASITIDSATTCTNDASFEFVLEAPSGSVVARNKLSRTTQCGRIGLFDLPETGEYILRVYDSFGVTGDYALAVALPGSNAVTYELDEIGSGTIEAGGEMLHIFQVAEDDTQVFFDSSGCGTGNNMQLLNLDDESVVRSENCFQDFSQTLTAGQWAVRFFSDDERGGSYTFRVWPIPEPAAPQDYTLDVSQFGELTFPTDANDWQFEIAEDGTEVYFDSQGCTSQLRWELRDSDGGLVRAQECFQEFSQVLDAGAWTIRVLSDSDDFGTYRFQVWEIQERQEFDYTLDVSQFGELTFPTDANDWQFEIAEDGTEVYFDSQGCTSQLRWELRDSDGGLVRAQECFQQFSQVLDAGTWTIRVLSDSDDFGTYRFQVWEIQERQEFDYTLDVSQFGELTFPTDSNRYSFDIANDSTEVYFDPQGCASSLRWELRDPNGAFVRARECFQDFSEVLDAGTWTIRVFSDDDSFGTYRFRLWEIPDRENFDYTIGDTTNVVLSFPTDSERYSFDVAADGTTLVFDAQGCNPTAQRWQLISPTGSIIRTRNCFQDFTETVNAGSYTLRVYTDDDRFGTFQFQVREQ